MNLMYVLRYIARHIGSAVRFFSHDMKPLATAYAQQAFFDPLVGETEYLRDCLSLATEKLPAILSVNQTMIYGSVRHDDGVFLIGPVRLEGEVVLKHSFSFDRLGSVLEQNTGIIHFRTFISNVLFLHNIFSETEWEVDLYYETIFPNGAYLEDIQKDYLREMFEHRETSRNHNPYEQEVREQSSIRNGDIDALKKSWSETYEGEFGRLADTKLRQYKNLAIIVASLAARSAIEGGILYETAFSLADSFCRKIERTDNPSIAGQLGRQAELQFAMMVREIQERRNHNQTNLYSTCAQCKKYVSTHLHENFRVVDIAEALGVHPNYLSTLFREKEGITLSAYIQSEKIKEVRGLLAFTNRSFVDIANYLGYSSQSYLGAIFKKCTGMTMKEYRTKYGTGE